MMNKLIKENIEDLQKVCKKNDVAELYVFGSALTDEFTDQIDLDFAYALKEDLTPIDYGDAFFRLMEDLKKLFEKKVDLISYRIVKNPILKKEIDRTKKSLYAAA